jgi:hypothetical protein
MMPVVVTMYVIRTEILFGSVWQEHHRMELTRVPAVGEFIDPHPADDRPDDDWYRVVMVVHSPADANCAATIFVKPVNYHEAFPRDEDDEARTDEELRITESSIGLRGQPGAK